MTTKTRKAAKTKAPRKRDSLAPRTKPPNPEHSTHRGFVYLPRAAGVIVNEDTAMTQSTVWACIKVISESLAGMPWRVGNLTTEGTFDPLDYHPLNWLLNFAPNDEAGSFAFRETLWAWALGWGNGYAEIERDFAGNPIALWGIHPCRVSVLRDSAGNLFYEVQNDQKPPTNLSPRQMFHLKGPSPDGYVGWSVIRMHARTIGLAIAQEQNASSLNENDSTPGGLLTTPQRLSDKARENVIESWERRHKGPKNRRTVALLEEDLKWQQTSINPDDAKLVEQMQLTPAMICRIFRVPPHKVADLTRSTNNNIEHQDIEFVKDTLRPWAERGEDEADKKLFGRNNQGKLITAIDLSERERGDTESQTNHVKEMIFNGVYSINEARRYLGLQSIGKIGDMRFVQSAMIPIEMAGKEQETEPSPEPDNEPPADEAMGRVQELALAVLTDACRRMLKRENDSRKLEGEALAAWLLKHRDYCRDILLPPSALLAECFKGDGKSVEVAVSLFLDKHFQSSPDGATAEAKAIELRSYLLAAAAAKEAA